MRYEHHTRFFRERQSQESMRKGQEDMGALRQQKSTHRLLSRVMGVRLRCDRDFRRLGHKPRFHHQGLRPVQQRQIRARQGRIYVGIILSADRRCTRHHDTCIDNRLRQRCNHRQTRLRDIHRQLGSQSHGRGTRKSVPVQLRNNKQPDSLGNNITHQLTMAEWHHHTSFRFYIQKYPQEGVTFSPIDIEEQFKCRYVSLEGAKPTKVKNIYKEDYLERSGKRIYVPKPAKLTYDTSDLLLTLRWRSDECGNVQTWSDSFFDYITGQKLEYHDTFRPDKYWQVLMEESPVIKASQLYGSPQFIFIQYKLANWSGTSFKESQLK